MSSFDIRNCEFAYRCNAQWSELLETSQDRVRFCSDCGKEVHRCDTDADLLRAIRLDRCVAIPQPDPEFEPEFPFLVGSPRQRD